MSESTDGTKREFHIGPAQAPWWKFKLAGVVWKLTRGNPFPGVGYIPGTSHAAKWAFKVRVMSRDFEEKSTDTETVASED